MAILLNKHVLICKIYRPKFYLHKFKQTLELAPIRGLDHYI
ncbi:MAG: hypothetical protein FD121_1027 [Gallionellaceae bacterium]|nr:MAG: hypothetical protein FD121_1027 [Gallionellaceae bacterium]